MWVEILMVLMLAVGIGVSMFSWTQEPWAGYWMGSLVLGIYYCVRLIVQPLIEIASYLRILAERGGS